MTTYLPPHTVRPSFHNLHVSGHPFSTNGNGWAIDGCTWAAASCTRAHCSRTSSLVFVAGSREHRQPGPPGHLLRLAGALLRRHLPWRAAPLVRCALDGYGPRHRAGCALCPCRAPRRAAPFETCQTYRLSVPGPGGRTGHPQAGAVRYGVVHATKVIYCVHMVRSMDDEGLYRLNTDVWLPYL